MLKGGYTGKILRINLAEQSYSVELVSEEMAKNYLGGFGFGIKYLFEELEPQTDPLSAKNKLIFSVGPFCGTSVPCASRMSIVSKSPLTGAVANSLTGGHFPAELKFAGYDMLIIEEAADQPTYLWINDDKVYFKSAKHLQGTNTFDCQQMIKDELNDQNIRIACIGQAGERQSRMASIINERHAAGRKGIGAVMGSKNLKAVAVRGNSKVEVLDEEKLKTARKRMLGAMKESPVLYPSFSKYGTTETVDVTWGIGVFPVKNFRDTGLWDPVDAIGGQANDKKKIAREKCYNCPVVCSQIRKTDDRGEYPGYVSVPEYETLYSFGGMTGVDNLDSIIVADRLCDEYGMDTMSVGATIAFAMELYENGILTVDDTGGLDLSFGNHAAMIELVKMIAFRKGLGELLADGTKIAAEKIGKGAEKFAMHVKGLELPGYDPRGAKAHGLNYATSYTGADHNRGYAFQEIFGLPVPREVDRFASEGKGSLTKWNQDMRSAVCDCPPMCGFLIDMAVPAIATENTADLLEALSGLKLSPEDVYRVGERVNNLARAFNVREGFTRKDDCFPDRIMTEPIKGGPSKGHLISRDELEFMLDDYYEARGWDEHGVPTSKKLIELGLDQALTALKQMGLIR